MGISSSSYCSNNGNNKNKSFIQELGDRHPFSDLELQTLVACYRHITSVEGDAGGNNSSFLVKLVTAEHMSRVSTGRAEDGPVATAPPNDPELEMRICRVQRAEQLLPHGFSNMLRDICFRDDTYANSFSYSNAPSKNNEELENFLASISECGGRRGSRAVLKAIHLCATSLGGRVLPQAENILDMCYRLAIVTEIFCATDERIEELSENQALPQSLIQSLARKIGKTNQSYSSYQSNEEKSEDDGVSLNLFTEWSESTVPLLSSILPTFFHNLLFPTKPYPPSRTPFIFPNLSLSDQPSAFFSYATSPLLFTFGCMSKSLCGKWFRLYTSDIDGLSFNRLQHSLVGYGGPTLMIIRAVSGGIFGAFTGSSWKESGSFYGKDDVFLFQIDPCVGVYRPRSLSGGSNFMYCNSFARSKGYDGQAHGIGFGGTTDQPRLFIPESFEKCVASSRDLTFEQGLILPPDEKGQLQKYFEIESLEVWGVGGDDIVGEALADRKKQRDVIQSNINKARKVDKAQFLDDFKSGLIESKAFAHREQMRGRDGGCELDEEES